MDERYQRDEAKCILLGEIRYRDMDPLSKLYHIKCVTIVVYYSEKLTNYIMKSLSPGDRDTPRRCPLFLAKRSSACDACFHPLHTHQVRLLLRHPVGDHDT